VNFFDVKQLVDIADVLDAHGLDGDTVAGGGKILCPFPWHDATEPGFSVVPATSGQVDVPPQNRLLAGEPAE
jgi:hypothetical protein